MGRRGRPDFQLNEEYRDLLSARDVLRRQLSIAKSDHEHLLKLRQMARADPLDFVRRIRNRSLPNVPIRQQVHYVPFVNFSRYAEQGEVGSSPALRPSPPAARSASRSRGRAGSNPPPEVVKPGDVVRGREFSASKPKTFNQLWSEEEHAKLLQLLEVYPEEAVAAHRWAKIARALGNRTPKQVASRTQKYFAKLKRMGLEPPGKAGGRKKEPKGDTLFQFKQEAVGGTKEQQTNEIKKAKEQKKVTSGKSEAPQLASSPTVKAEPVTPPSSQLSESREQPSPTVPVAASHRRNEVYRPPPMSMDDEDDSTTLSQVTPDMQDSSTYQELVRLRKLREEMLASNETPVTGPDGVIHDGFACDRCGADPIVGRRWHCTDCPEGEEVDLCGQCKEEGFESAAHTAEHRLVSLEEAQESSLVDKDYANFSLGASVETSYLDPQFMPS